MSRYTAQDFSRVFKAYDKFFCLLTHFCFLQNPRVRRTTARTLTHFCFLQNPRVRRTTARTRRRARRTPASSPSPARRVPARRTPSSTPTCAARRVPPAPSGTSSIHTSPNRSTTNVSIGESLCGSGFPTKFQDKFFYLCRDFIF